MNMAAHLMHGLFSGKAGVLITVLLRKKIPPILFAIKEAKHHLKNYYSGSTEKKFKYITSLANEKNIYMGLYILSI